MANTEWKRRSSNTEIMGFREFYLEWRDYGFKVATQNWLFCFTKWYLGAKRLRVYYK